MAENGALSANQKKALTALLSHATVAKAAEACGLGTRTLTRYLAKETFRVELWKRQDAIVSSVTAALVGLAGDAVAALQDILESKDASDAVKVRAALGWLAQMRQSVELADLVDRIGRLEKVLTSE